MKTRRLLLLLLVAAAIAAFFAFDLGRYLSLEALKARQEALSAYAALHPGRSAALFFALYTAATALSIPGAAILTLGAGAVFGFWLGLLIVSFASSIGADAGLSGGALPAARHRQAPLRRTRQSHRSGHCP
jgi:uncharacterized membrane protein YdjX (TVP38/TMEM64 family)